MKSPFEDAAIPSYLPVMREGLTIKGIADRLGILEEPERSELLQRLRYWTKIGLLVPALAATGRGRWRTYDETAIARAAELNRLRKSMPASIKDIA